MFWQLSVENKRTLEIGLRLEWFLDIPSMGFCIVWLLGCK